MKWTQLYGSSNILWHCPSLGLEQKPNFSSHIASVFQICWHLECSTLTASSFRILVVQLGFPGGSAGKESACNAGDFGSIPGLGRSTGEGIGCPLQYSWAFLMAQLIKNLPAMRETWVQSLGWEDSLEEGMATHSSILAWRIPWTEEPGGIQSMGSQRVSHVWVTNTFTSGDQMTLWQFWGPGTKS